jgi:FkbM family methyltransferase
MLIQHTILPSLGQKMRISFLTRRFSPRKSLYEYQVRKRISKTKGEIFVDIGANVGIYSILLASNFKKVLAVEPNPTAVSELERRLAAENIENVTIVPCAISDTDGETMLYLDATPGRCNGSADTILSVFEYKPPSAPNLNISFKSKTGVLVKTCKLDTLLKDYPGEIDLVKIDVEGAEFHVLRGAEKSLDKIRMFIVELHNRDRKKELEILLSSRRFKLEWLDKDHLLASA